MNSWTEKCSLMAPRCCALKSLMLISLSPSVSPGRKQKASSIARRSSMRLARSVSPARFRDFWRENGRTDIVQYNASDAVSPSRGCRCTPPSLKRMPSASSAETTRCRARTPALGTLPLDSSQAVRQGREISCCDRPRSAQHAAGNFNNRHVGIVCAASARVNVRIFYQPLTAPTGLGLLLTLPPRQASSSVGQRAARSLPERWPAVLSRGDAHSQRFKAIDSRTEEGAALIAAPF
jgi:hypothetical protein